MKTLSDLREPSSRLREQHVKGPGAGVSLVGWRGSEHGKGWRKPGSQLAAPPPHAEAASCFKPASLQKGGDRRGRAPSSRPRPQPGLPTPASPVASPEIRLSSALSGYSHRRWPEWGQREDHDDAAFHAPWGPLSGTGVRKHSLSRPQIVNITRPLTEQPTLPGAPAAADDTRPREQTGVVCCSNKTLSTESAVATASLLTPSLEGSHASQEPRDG